MNGRSQDAPAVFSELNGARRPGAEGVRCLYLFPLAR